MADAYEQYLADAAYEDYLRQAQAEQQPSQQPKQQASSYNVGADYSSSFGGNALRGALQTPQALIGMGQDAWNLATSPIQTISNAGAEKTLNTVGSLAAGTAGAASLGTAGAELGLLGGPWGAVLGGVVGGGLGFAGGLLGFDVGKDAASQAVTGQDYLRPASQYAKDFAYNAGQGTLLSGLSEAGGAAINSARGIGGPGVEPKVAEALTKLEPDLANQINTANTAAANSGDPFLLNKSLGETIGSDKLKNLERTMAMSSPDSFGKSAQASQARMDAQLKYLDSIDQSNVTPADAQAAMQQGFTQDIAAKQSSVDAATAPVTNALEQLPAPIDTSIAGMDMRDNLSSGLGEQRAKVQKGFEGIGNGVVDPTGIAAVAAQEIPNYFREVGAQPSGPLSELAGQLSKEGEPTGLLDASGQPMTNDPVFTMRDMQAARSKALEVQKGGDRRSGAIAGKLIDAMDVAVNDAVKRGDVTPEEAASWRSGIAERKIQGDIYENKGLPTKSVLAKEYSGANTVPDSAVPSRYFKSGEKGSREAVQNYKRAVGSNDAALEPLYRYAADSFRAYAVKDGVVNSTKANTWLRDHASALSELPDLKRQLADVHSRQQFLNEKYGDLQRTQAETEKGALQYFLKVDANKAVPTMLSGKDMIKRTKSTVDYLKGKDPDALAGLRRGVIEHMQGFFKAENVDGIKAAISGDTPFKGDLQRTRFANEWDRIKPALVQSKLFTDSQLKGFDYLYNDMKSAASIAKAKIPGDSGTAQNLSTLAAIKGMAIGSFLSKFPATKYISAIVKPMLQAIPRAKFNAALEEALLNPMYARDLMNKASAKNVTRSVEQIFRDELKQAFGDTTPGAALTTGLKTAAPFLPVADRKQQQAKPQQVISKKSFPNPKELLAPPAPGTLKKTSLNLQAYSPETRARIATESNNNPDAVSKKGATGLAQLMPETAQEIAKQLGEPYYPITPGMTQLQREISMDQNVRFGDHYLKQQMKEFKNPTLAWAAYNAGPGAVKNAMALAGTSRDVTKIMQNLPKETRDYAERIVARLTSQG